VTTYSRRELSGHLFDGSLERCDLAACTGQVGAKGCGVGLGLGTQLRLGFDLTTRDPFSKETVSQ
jgi:hypothetical protein